jgi:starch phosphorylase
MDNRAVVGWFEEERIAQEMVLGIGGVRALRALKKKVDIYHFNEDTQYLQVLSLLKKKRKRI